MRKYGDEFGFDKITEGSFVDEGFKVKTCVVRLSCTAMNEWIKTSVLNNRYTYETAEEWESYKAAKKEVRQSWEDKILKKFNFAKINGGGYSIAQNVSEIFTVVMFEKM